MAEIKLNKASLSQQQKALKNYKRFLPSLDLKRQKILVEKNKATNESITIGSDIDTVKKHIHDKLTMLADSQISLNEFIKIKNIDMEIKNVAGINLSYLKGVQFEKVEFTLFNSPHWLDEAILQLQTLTELNIAHEAIQKRVAILQKSLQTVTQRKNLFEKVLIPRAMGAIRTIQIFLADNERAAVVRSKITKKRET